MDVGKIDELVAILGASRSSELLVRKGQNSVHIVRGAKAKKPVVAAPMQRAETPATAAAMDDIAHIRSSKVGIFHSAESAPEPGDSVHLGQPLGVIESMKIHNEILSEVSGVILEMFVENGSPVEYGQELYRIRKS